MSAPVELRPHWTLDRRIPVAMIAGFIVTIALQTAGAIWWARGVVATVDQHDRRIEAIERSMDKRDEIFLKLAETVARIDERQKGVLSTLNEIKIELNTHLRPPNSTYRNER